jgi:hypothetical protein
MGLPLQPDIAGVRLGSKLRQTSTAHNRCETFWRAALDRKRVGPFGCRV